MNSDFTMTDVRRRWTPAEDALLWELYQVQESAPTGKCQKVNWNDIAQHIPGRSNKDCRKRYFNRFTDGLRKGSWTQEEDDRLLQLVERYQFRWAAIAQRMETRNADQCSKRWHHCLNPDLERSPWTDGENNLLLSAVETHGSSWKDIQKCHFPTRSANNIKNQYTVLSRKCLNTVHPQPCCPQTTKSSRRPTSTHSSTTSSSRGVSEYSAPTSAYYTSPSISSQLDYLPATPEAPSGYDFDPSMGLPTSACGYSNIPGYQGSYCPNVADNSGMMMPDPSALGYDYGLGLFPYQGQRGYGM
ncbi:Homeodomain-like protein [Aspergillus oleicola]